MWQSIILLNRSKKLWLLLYLGFTTITWGCGYLVELCTYQLIGNAIYGDWLYNYSSITVFLASFSLFMFFKQIEVNGNAFKRGLQIISRATFGVYLIHTTKGLWKLSDDILVNRITEPFQYLLVLGLSLTTILTHRAH